LIFSVSAFRSAFSFLENASKSLISLWRSSFSRFRISFNLFASASRRSSSPLAVFSNSAFRCSLSFLVDSLKDKCSFNRKLRTSSNLGEKTQISTMRFVASSTVDITILKKIENKPKTQGFKFYFQPFNESARIPPSAGLGH